MGKKKDLCLVFIKRLVYFEKRVCQECLSLGPSLVVQWVRLTLATHRARVQSLVGELDPACLN